MKKHLFIFISALLSLTSCSHNPREEAAKIVMEYISAIQNGNLEKISSLTYNRSANENESVIEDVFGSEVADSTLMAIKELRIDPICEITKDSQINIEEVSEIYIGGLGIDAGYIVSVRVEGRSNPAHIVSFTVAKTSNDGYKIYSTKGLYSYDVKKFSEMTGCAIQLPDVKSDVAMEEWINRFLIHFKHFNLFSYGVEKNDSSKIYQVFPKLKDYRYKFNNKPIAVKYVKDSLITIYCADSTVYRISPNGEIIDCKGVISFDKEKNEIENLGGTLSERENQFDLEYIKDVKEQLEKAKQEYERKIRAAKYKAQGVALLSSRFTNNGKGAKGVEYEALNTSNKTAKYIIMEVVGYNSVDDPVWSGGYLKRCQGIGPIGPGESATWNFNELWDRGDLVRSYEIKALIIQFTDGTSKTVKLPSALPADYRDWLY